jgi:hypothetical protein
VYDEFECINAVIRLKAFNVSLAIDDPVVKNDYRVEHGASPVRTAKGRCISDFQSDYRKLAPMHAV